MNTTHRWALAYFLWIALCTTAFAAGDASDLGGGPAFPRPVDSYQDGHITNIFAKLAHRAASEPFNIVATLLFFGALTHTFLAAKFMEIAQRCQDAIAKLDETEGPPEARDERAAQRERLQFRAQVFHFMGEVEAIFGIWLIPLALAIIAFKGWGPLVRYAGDTSFAEPVFVVVVMAIAASRPVLRAAESCLAKVAALGESTPSAWWLAILTVGPLLGSFITEPAAMTICALLLNQRFYELNPSNALRYATLGLLFVNISVGGTLSHFAAPPVVMVAHKWNWGFGYMFTHFGWKAIIGILVANGAYYLLFHREFCALDLEPATVVEKSSRVPIAITILHLLLIAWTVLCSHYPPLVVLGFLFFLAFVEATERHQHAVQFRGPMLVGFFLAALVLHGGCQEWWIAPVLSSLTKWPLMIGATLLTALNDNAAITYLASLVPDFSEQLKYAVVAGAVAGGGLTVIANAPNPAGQSILRAQFDDDAIAPGKLFFAALLPTLIMGAAFALLP